MCTGEGPKPTSKALGRVLTVEGPELTPIALGEWGLETVGELGWGLAQCLSGRENSETNPPSAYFSQEDQQLAWPV